MRGEFVDVEGARLYYYAAGSRGAGEPVVFVHGFATSGHLWSEVVSLMPPGRRLIVPDLLGHGRSDPARTRPLTLRAHAERIVALLDVLRVSAACVVGHGVGGGIAQSLAIGWPNRVSRLGLVASVAFDRWLSREVAMAQAALPVLRRLPPAWLLSMVRTALERGYGDPHRAAHSIARYTRPFATREGQASLVRHIAALDARETRALASHLHEIAIPVTIVGGAQDALVGAAQARRLAAAIPGATLTVVPGARHFLSEEAPRPVADALTVLLARPAPASGPPRLH